MNLTSNETRTAPFAPTVQAPAPPRAPLNILLIEDNPMDAQLIRAMLMQADDRSFVLHHVDCLAAGLERLTTGDIRLVISDLSLPDCHGSETFAKVHAQAPNLPIIVLTGQADEQMAIHTVHEGAQDYLVKGEVDARMLVRAIHYGLERKRAEVALENERDLLQTLQDNIPDRIFFKDLKSCFLRVNRAWTRLFNLKSPCEALGKTDFDFFSQEHARLAFADEGRIMKTGEPLLDFVEKETFPDGHSAWVITSKLPLRDNQGNIVGTFGISRDITRLKDTEEKLKNANAELVKSHEEIKAAQLDLIQAEKMQSVGRLAAGVAHEVKNPLAILSMSADYLAGELPANSASAGVVQEMKAAIERADTIVRGLLDFSRAQDLSLEPADLQKVVEHSIQLVKHELVRCPIRLATEFEPKLPPVLMDAEKIKQVLINVLTNAIHAMPGGGELKIRTGLQTLQPGDTPHDAGSRLADRLRVGDTVAVIEVSDTGQGIPPDKLDKIFDPFFTTKPTGKGTGLGLTVCKKIIDLHGGIIQIKNQDEGGASVTIKLKIN